MRLFDKIFGRQTKIKNDYKELPILWEDDYCQIEIVPRRNIKNIISSTDIIENFTKKAGTDYGFTDIYMREALPFPTINEELRIDYFENFLTGKGFERAKQIRHNGSKIIDCSTISLDVFSLPCFNFFYDYENGFIKNIWISTSNITSEDYCSKILETLYEIGESNDLVLIDRNCSNLIDLTDRKQIKDYLVLYFRKLVDVLPAD